MWELKVNHESHVCFVDAHTECHGSCNDSQAVIAPGLLNSLAFHVFKTCMVVANEFVIMNILQSFLQVFTDLLTHVLRSTVNDARLIQMLGSNVVGNIFDGGFIALLLLHLILQFWAIEALLKYQHLFRRKVE